MAPVRSAHERLTLVAARGGILLRPRVALVQLDGCRTGPSAAPDSDVQQFDENRGIHREVDVALGMCWSKPSSRRAKPISSRKLRASIFRVGWRVTRPATASAETSITTMATVTAAIVAEP